MRRAGEELLIHFTKSLTRLTPSRLHRDNRPLTEPDFSAMESSRIGWVDTAKGICIIFVVMMHSTIGIQIAEGREGWMNYVILFAWPFRMPDFFLISGLFLAQVID